jgi:hypothetical protein
MFIGFSILTLNYVHSIESTDYAFNVLGYESFMHTIADEHPLLIMVGYAITVGFKCSISHYIHTALKNILL